MGTKRTWALFLAMILLFTCLTGCGETNADNSAGSIDGTSGALSENDGGSDTDSELTDGNIDTDIHEEETTGAAAVSDDYLKIYSLRENETVRQVIDIFQTLYPNIEVEYKIGIKAGSSVTRKEALENLNAKITAGAGPDVLVLDDIPFGSYIEKGLLLDLNDILGGLSGEEEVFDNIVQAMKKDGKVYAMPCEIRIPVMAGAEKYISQIKDLKSMADVMEELRKDNPGKSILDIYTKKGIMRYFAISCVPAWTTEEGELDRKAIEEFLTQTKRIYDAQTDGLPQELIEEEKIKVEDWMEGLGVSEDSIEDTIYFRAFSNVHIYVSGKTQLAYTALARTSAYDEMVSMNRMDGFEESKWTVMNGQSSNVFCAQTLLGINAASGNTQLAEKFIRLCFSKENQSNLFYGLAVNKAAFEENFIVESHDEFIEKYRDEIVAEVGEESIEYLLIFSDAYSGVEAVNEEGESVWLFVYSSDEEQIADLRKCVEAADTPYIEDTGLEYAVYGEGILYMQGEQSLEEAVSAIERKISIYMTE